ncbi:hypothetical protein CASFOL_021956 [Castilleja foliolosa]|uniref:F-box domain-containing protein n=1 Tax=Castilleja foliolosa TaxID=1961234 RepID=A0ABD3CYZ3_9LAMI
MNRQSAKRREDDDDGSAVTTDRLSQLPQPVLHNILSLLPQRDAIRTCVLSKSWRYLWHGRFIVEFWEPYNRFTTKNEFWPFLDKTLQRYLDQNLSLQKFLVYIIYEVDFVLLQKWIPLVIMNMGVRSLTLNLSWSTKAYLPLPLVVFQSESLVELHLTLCDLNTLKSTDNIMLNNLQTLRLHYVDITDEIFEKIISGCPLIENLDMFKCIGLKSIKFHKHHNLKYIDCSVNVPLVIEFDDPLPLESVRIQNFSRDWFLSHKNMQFPHLKSLDLYRVQLPAHIFDNFSSFFPCLNELSLNECKGLKEFLLLSSSIKRLILKMDQRDRIKAFIDTPNILYFEYSGRDFLPSIEFATTSNEWASHISVWYKLERSDNDATSWFLKLNKLLIALSQSHITLKIIRSNNDTLHIKDSDGRLYKPVVLDHLRLLECLPSSSDPAILNCFLRICRPWYIYVDLYGDVRAKCNFAEYISKLIPDETGCFWLQDLEEVSIEVWDIKAEEWNCVELTSLQAMHNNQHQIRFRLTWKEQ